MRRLLMKGISPKETVEEIIGRFANNYWAEPREIESVEYFDSRGLGAWRFTIDGSQTEYIVGSHASVWAIFGEEE